ncbi:MAG: HNH endonuclease [Geobacter sp.]|nr:HNH endonuclease [Geobacter sp.]
MSIPSAEEQLRFISGIQKILDEGSFVATYKFALLMALADFAVQSGLNGGDPEQLSTIDLAESFICSYWRQARPYSHAQTDGGMLLKMSSDRQPVVFRRIAELREKYNGRLADLRNSTGEWQRLKREVANTIAKMPLWKLQVVGSTVVTLLYRQDGQGYQGNRITLMPGVLSCLRLHYELVRSLVQSAWLRHVRRLNMAVLQDRDLDAFLFDSERTAWPSGLRTILRDVQKGTCLYCGGVISDAGDIDHFIPWARYPLELGHNFVLAHAGCNRSKSDLLAAPRHLSAWHTRNVYYTDTMEQAFEAISILHDYDTTRRIVGWAYTQAESNKGALWDSSNQFVPADASWRAIIT